MRVAWAFRHQHREKGPRGWCLEAGVDGTRLLGKLPMKKRVHLAFAPAASSTDAMWVVPQSLRGWRPEAGTEGIHQPMVLEKLAHRAVEIRLSIPRSASTAGSLATGRTSAPRSSRMHHGIASESDAGVDPLHTLAPAAKGGVRRRTRLPIICLHGKPVISVMRRLPQRSPPLLLWQ